MAKLSVVVPFHNVEDYIGAALQSIARQTLRDLEVILVDDGSGDASALIAKGYVSRDPRFRLIQQENAGPGLARNAGIREATGEYLAFFDGDDLLDPHAYGLMTETLDRTGSDIATGGGTKIRPPRPPQTSPPQAPVPARQMRAPVSRGSRLPPARTPTSRPLGLAGVG